MGALMSSDELFHVLERRSDKSKLLHDGSQSPDFSNSSQGNVGTRRSAGFRA